MKTGAVIVLYRPDERAEELISNISQQVDVLCVVDNSADRAFPHRHNSNIVYHHFPDNIGIAAAQNVGLRELCQADCRFGLLFDQDSQVDGDFVEKMSSLLNSPNHLDSFAAIGPSIICSFSDELMRSRIQKEIPVNEHLLKAEQIISSGMILDLLKLEEIGFKDEGLFIDGVDHEWCWRAKTKAYSVAIARNLSIRHSIGDARGKLAGVTYKVGSPIRLYYQFRNILLLSRRNYVPRYWIFRNVTLLPVKFFANALLQQGKKERFRFMLRGLIDGLRNKSGPYQSNWNAE